VTCRRLRPLTQADHFVVREIYADAIESQGVGLYSPVQISAWAALAWLPGVLDRPLLEGSGWLSIENDEVEAFALRYPADRLALLYCRGRSVRCGHATALLLKVESEALHEGYEVLVAEASLYSHPLLLKCGWTVKGQEVIQIGGVNFDRYRMEKKLQLRPNQRSISR
jgi:hypothetical protein|tara:strand:+ start:1484 stop:1987 length:504 start_codon:yes stop_codon:yes gene_type:complete